MKQYEVELTSTVTVKVDAENEKEAIDKVMDDDASSDELLQNVQVEDVVELVDSEDDTLNP